MFGLKSCVLMLLMSLPLAANASPDVWTPEASLVPDRTTVLDIILRPDPSEIQMVEFLPESPEPTAEQLLLARAKAENPNRSSMRSAQLSQTECLATAMYHEARGEGVIGMKAVAYVIYNRTQSSRFPKGYCEVVLQKSQFSFVSDRNPDNIKSWDVYEIALKLAVELIERNGFVSEKSPVGSALFFNSLAFSKKRLYSYGRKYVATIGHHHFFR